MLEAQPAALEAGGVVTGGTVHLLWLIVSSFSFYSGRKGEGERNIGVRAKHGLRDPARALPGTNEQPFSARGGAPPGLLSA